MMADTVVVITSPHNAQRAADLAARLQLPLLQEGEAPAADVVATLRYDDGGLQLAPADQRQSGPVRVDFDGGAIAHRLQGGAELIAKAVRGRSKQPLQVLDATAGLGRDSFVLASREFNVRMLERSPIVAALLADGLERAQTACDARLSEIVSRMTLTAIDAIPYLQALDAAQYPDVIYLDPMFPPSDKSALVKKEMRLFQQLFHSGHERVEHEDGAANNHAELLRQARRCARLRVVVKRPRKAEALAGQAPDYALEGKSVRFDVYVTKAVVQPDKYI